MSLCHLTRDSQQFQLSRQKVCGGSMQDQPLTWQLPGQNTPKHLTRLKTNQH